MKRNYRRRGISLVEALMAAVLTAVSLTTGLGVFMTGTMAWYRGEGNIDAEVSSHTAIRIIAQELRQAMSVTVDPNGLGLSYTLPATDVSGTMVVPIQADGVTRRIELDGSTLNIIANGVPRKVCDSVILTDPFSPGGTSPYVIFMPGSGATTRQVTVMVVDQKKAFQAEQVTGRNRETVFLRNVPQLN